MGRKLYSSHPLLIVVREVIQNALDAAAARGVEPMITIALDLSDNAVNVTCQDNGIGMSPEVITNSFLTIGATNKPDGSIGGFGIAAAAIMSCDEWSVHTLDWVLSHDDLGKRPVRKSDTHVDGTVISVRIMNPKCHRWHVADVYRMLAFSDAQVHFVVRRGEITLLDTMVGLQADLTLLEENLTPVGWALKGTEPISIPNFDYGDGCAIGGNVQGFVFLRLNGLVQFDLGHSDDRRKTNLIVDIVDPPPVSSTDYQFSMSRERLTDPLNSHVLGAIRPHTNNPLTSARIIREPEVSLTILPGQVLSGSGDDVGIPIPRDTADACPQPAAWMENAFSLTASSVPAPARTPQQLKVLLRDYRYHDIPLAHWKVLTLWAEVVKLVAPADEVFGVGLTAASVEAERITYEGDVYYVINPTSASHRLRGQALALRLWGLACHEIAHLACPDHSEMFTSEMDRLIAESSGRFAKALTTLVKVYNQRQKPSWLLPISDRAARPQEELPWRE